MLLDVTPRSSRALRGTVSVKVLQSHHEVVAVDSLAADVPSVTTSTMLLVVSVAFLVTNLPMAVCMLGWDAWISRAHSIGDVARLHLFQGTCSDIPGHLQ